MICKDQPVPPRYPKAEALKYGEPKKLRQFMLTETASSQIDELADNLGSSRSDALEQLLRAGATKLMQESEAVKKP